MKFKNKARLKATLLSAAAIATSFIIGMASACSNVTTDDDEDDKTVTKQDVQVIKNGNFEFYDDNDGLYPISNPDNWTSGSSGSSSNAMGGIIDTAKARWDYITDKDLPATLEANNDLSSTDENKKDYNNVLTNDLLYKNTHNATLSEDDEKFDNAYIDNPFTHSYKYDADGNLTDAKGNAVKTYEKDDKVYLDEEYTKELETSVLMLHNYRPSYYRGTETYFSSSSTVTLEARTAAKISVWVKTAELYFDGAKNERTKVEDSHGAYIKLDTQVGGNPLDSFYIRNIDTETINTDGENNGWVQYTMYVQASSFATTTLSITLGLGQNEIYTVEGYAFFDDIELTTYESSNEMIKEVDGESAGEFEKLTKNSTANLLTPDGKSEFRVDKESVQTNNPSTGTLDKWVDNHNFGDTHFYIDLASSGADDDVINLTEGVSAGLTVEQTTTGKYVSAKNDPYFNSNVKKLENGAGNAYLPSNTFKARNTAEDILAAFEIKGENWKFDINGSEHGDVLTKALSSAASLPNANGSTSALLLLSAHGAAYEAEMTNDSFTLDAGEYALVSFWLKTSDMEGKTAATVTVKEVVEKGEDDNSANFTLDTTTLSGVTINDKEDIYDGWTECFIRVENTSKEGAPTVTPRPPRRCRCSTPACS